MTRDRSKDLGRRLPAWALLRAARGKKGKPGRVLCGARRRRDGQPCTALSVPGKRRCKWHGGCSTGPRTPEGKAAVTRNLPRRRAEGSSGGAE